LIIQIEEETRYDQEWQDDLVNLGMQVPVPDNAQDGNLPAAGLANDDVGDVHPGLVFHEDLMQKLFDSPLTSAQRRP